MFEKFGKTIDRFVQALGTETTATRIDTRTDPISAPYPEGDLPELRLELNVGKVNLSAGADKLVDGTVTYNVSEWAPHVSTEGKRVTVRQDVGFHLVGSWHELRNDWKVALGTARPFSFVFIKGAGEAQMALGGVPLESAYFDVGAGKLQLSFDKVNPTQSNSLKVSLGAGSVSADGLLNANTSSCVFSGGAGEQILSFTGESLQRAMTVKLSTGAGKIVLNVKRGVPCQVTVRKFLGTVHPQGNFQMAQPQLYETTGFALAGGPTLKIEIDTPVADIVLNDVE